MGIFTSVIHWCFFFLHQELECLQDHLEDLVSNCREVVGNLTELESEVCFISYSTAGIQTSEGTGS